MCTTIPIQLYVLANDIRIIIYLCTCIRGAIISIIDKPISFYNYSTVIVYISNTDAITGELLTIWSIDIMAARPTISRAFTVTIPIREEQIEKVLCYILLCVSSSWRIDPLLEVPLYMYMYQACTFVSFSLEYQLD